MKNMKPITLFFIVVFLLAMICWFVSDIRTFIISMVNVLTSSDANQMKQYLLSFGNWGPVMVILLLVIQAILSPIPAFIVMVGSLWIYGPFLGGIYALIGGQAGAVITYWIARRLGRPYIERLIGEKQLASVEELFNTYGLYAIFLARITPVFSVDAISYAAGAGKMNFRRFFLSAAAGQILAIAVFAVLGEEANSLLEFAGYLIVGGAVAFIVGFIFKKKFARDKTQDKEQ